MGRRYFIGWLVDLLPFQAYEKVIYPDNVEDGRSVKH